MKLSILSRFFQPRAGPNDRRDSPISSRLKAFLLGEDVGLGLASTAGVRVNEETALRVTGVYACVRVIAETVASLPLPLFRRLDRGKEKVTAHPLYSILHDMPNPEMTSFTFREVLMTQLLLWGNAYAQIVRGKGGQVLELWPLSPAGMENIRDEKTKQLVYRHTEGMKTTEYKPEQILHIPGLGFDGVKGLSPIAMAREAIGLALATEEFGARFFGNGARPGGILEHPGVVKDPEKLRKSWEEVYKGLQNSHKIAVLEEGMKYHEIGIPSEDAQFLETRKFQLNEICRLFRVPPHLVGDLERATFSNIEHQSIDFVVHTIRPWLVRWEQAIIKDLLLPEERKLYFGTGTGQPLGILNSDALVKVSKENGQTELIRVENLFNMWSRLWGRSRTNAVWYINQEIEPLLFTMKIGDVPVYIPAGGLSEAPYATLFGRPVVPLEQCSAAGEVGDIILADMSQYLLIDKGGINAASSIHVRFLYDENVYRFIYRVDGQPIWNKPLQPYKGSASVSPFVALASRK